MKKAIIIGAGAIGLAIGRELAMAGVKTTILEKNPEVGSETSFRNSAVVHAGIYYPTGSLKAELCRPGMQLLYEYCAKKKINHNKIGKLILAAQAEQEKKLEHLQKQAQENGADDIVLLSKKEVMQMEPDIQCSAALFSPSTGVLDIMQLITALREDFIELGGEILTSAECKTIAKKEEFYLEYLHQNRIETKRCDLLINSAGLFAQHVARSMDFLDHSLIPGSFYAKGNYFRLTGSSPFSHLIYPLPEKAGLGIHATVDINGIVRFGPDVQWTLTPDDYVVDESRHPYFLAQIREYYPDIDARTITPEFVGIRPKIKPQNEQPQDFMIQDEQKHGHRGLINLFGMESPGLTSSLAIAKKVAKLLLH